MPESSSATSLRRSCFASIDAALFLLLSNALWPTVTTSKCSERLNTSCSFSIRTLKAVDGDKLKTYVIPRGRITTAEKTADVHSASTKYNVTIKTFPFELEDTNGKREVYVVEYRDDGRPASSGSSGGGSEA